MVFINNQKFACESCIKGHRSSSCHHNDRPLFEVKKKGRPVSQCEKCRDLRKTKRVHSKCECSNNEVVQPPKRQITANSKRYIPIMPALPNGLKDAYTARTSAIPPRANPRAKVTTLLNPCHCKDVWSCNCRAAQHDDTDDADDVGLSSANICDNSGLTALADAAALCCSQDLEAAQAVSTADDSALPESSGNAKQKRSCCNSPGKSPFRRSKRRRQGSRSHSPMPHSVQEQGPELPPILCTNLHDTTLSNGPPPPTFPEIPPLSSIASLAGSGCCCGFMCTCPGCLEHRGTKHASKDHSDCGDECRTCIDYESGIELPSESSATSRCGSSISSEQPSASSSFIDTFFARAAATIPAPPARRTSGLALDPMNVKVYPTSLFSSADKDAEKRAAAWGLVRVPKLECCSGRCGCPGETCGCGKTCDGCCEQHADDGEAQPSNSTAGKEVAPTPKPTMEIVPTIGGCCSSKNAAGAV